MLIDPKYTAPNASLVQRIHKSLTKTTISGLPGSGHRRRGLHLHRDGQGCLTRHRVPDRVDAVPRSCPHHQSRPAPGPRVALRCCPRRRMAEQALNENKITFSLPSGVRKPGRYDVSAIYVGDLNHRSSPSSLGTLLVTKVPTTLSLESSRNPAFDGGRLVLRAVITA